MFVDEVEQGGEKGFVAEIGVGPAMLREDDAILVRDDQRGRGADPFDLALRGEAQIIARRLEDGELQAGGARVERQHRIGQTAVSRPVRCAACAISTATAQEAMRADSASARLVRMIGTRAPTTTPAASAPARKVSCLARILPATRSGTTRMSACPATGETIPFSAAASGLTALSKARGPSNTAPVIWPRSAILQSAAASSVEGSFEFTVSMADRIATRGLDMPNT